MKTTLKWLGISALAGAALITGSNVAGLSLSNDTAVVDSPAPATDSANTAEPTAASTPVSSDPTPAPPTAEKPAAPAAQPKIITNPDSDKPYSYEAIQVAKMAQKGVDSTVILAYIQNSQSATSLTVDEIIYLRNQGVSTDAISALIQRGSQIQASRAAATPAPVASQPAAIAQPAPTTVVAAPAPQIIYNYSEPEPSYLYVNPPVYYNYSWWPYYNTWGYNHTYYFYNNNWCYRPIGWRGGDFHHRIEPRPPIGGGGPHFNNPGSRPGPIGGGGIHRSPGGGGMGGHGGRRG